MNTKNILHRYPLNKCSKFLLLSLKSFVAEKRHEAMQKLFIKKTKTGRVEKMDTKMSEIFKTMGTLMPKKEEMNKIALFSSKCF